MKIIYIDSDYICHAENAEGRTPIETDVFDNVSDVALECYKFIPAHDGKVDFIQCFDSKTADKIQRQFNVDSEVMNNVLTQIETALGITEVENDNTGTSAENS